MTSRVDVSSSHYCTRRLYPSATLWELTLHQMWRPRHIFSVSWEVLPKVVHAVVKCSSPGCKMLVFPTSVRHPRTVPLPQMTHRYANVHHLALARAGLVWNQVLCVPPRRPIILTPWDIHTDTKYSRVQVAKRDKNSNVRFTLQRRGWRTAKRCVANAKYLRSETWPRLNWEPGYLVPIASLI